MSYQFTTTIGNRTITYTADTAEGVIELHDKLSSSLLREGQSRTLECTKGRSFQEVAAANSEQLKIMEDAAAPLRPIPVQ